MSISINFSKLCDLCDVVTSLNGYGNLIQPIKENTATSNIKKSYWCIKKMLHCDAVHVHSTCLLNFIWLWVVQKRIFFVRFRNAKIYIFSFLPSPDELLFTLKVWSDGVPRDTITRVNFEISFKIQTKSQYELCSHFLFYLFLTSSGLFKT